MVHIFQTLKEFLGLGPRSHFKKFLNKNESKIFLLLHDIDSALHFQKEELKLVGFTINPTHHILSFINEIFYDKIYYVKASDQWFSSRTSQAIPEEKIIDLLCFFKAEYYPDQELIQVYEKLKDIRLRD